MSMGKEIVFTIHNEIHRVTADKIGPETSLNTYLRDHAGLKGTKGMCYEGGCGACIVTATVRDPISKIEKHIAVNSCLVPILACHDWNISTVEGIGNRRMGYHRIQRALAKFSGTQCGYCTSGMVMNMHALMEENEYLSVKDVENAFGGNICRCTGYRPIMDACKSLCYDADKELVNKFPDIEDIVCEKTGKVCTGTCKSDWELIHDAEDKTISLIGEDVNWYKVYTIANIIELFQTIGDEVYRLVAGNTGQGVYKITEKVKIYIEITSVPDLVTHKLNTNLVLGGNVSLTEVMKIMTKISESYPNFWHLKKVTKHIDVIANVPVRNIGTLAGNLSLKHAHREFPSDIFLLLECIGAWLVIVQKNGSIVTKSLLEYLDFDMKKCLIKSVVIPPVNKNNHIFESYKITPRVQNAHAYVNAGFMLELDGKGVVKDARIVYGGINPGFVHAKATEKLLINKNLFSNSTLQAALRQLNEEIVPNAVLTDASPKFRKDLALALFYKFVLKSAPKELINPKNLSGGMRISRPLSSGYQDYTSDKKMYPLTQPIPKIEALIQCSGEIQYVNDIPCRKNDLFGAFVLVNAAPYSTVKNFDVAEALAQPGVVTFITHKDIPGRNAFTPPPLSPTLEELFCSGKVVYNGQALGLILADTHQQAVNAAKLVKISYTRSDKNPLYNIREVLKSGETSRISLRVTDTPKSKGTDVKYKVKGSYDMGGQYHFTMETQSTYCVPTDDGGYDVFAATQWMDHVQMSISLALKIPQNKINVSVKRLGGAYGAKLLRATQVATAAAVASYKTNQPVRIHMPLQENMMMLGKRVAIHSDYEVGVNADGVIQYMETKFYHDHGVSGDNELAYQNTQGTIKSCYNFDTWHNMGYVVQTDMAGNCYCRAPGSVDGIGIIENIMEHIATVTKKDPVEVRLANVSPENTVIKNFVEELKTACDYNNRKAAVLEYNQKNRWMKKGISLIMMKYPFEIFGTYSVFISIYAGDGTVAISHGGIECGQGLNTKVVQVCAYMLGITIDMVSIKASNTLNSPNNFMSGGSITSEACCYATMEACKTLLKRLEPYKINTNQTWQQLVAKAHSDDVELSATHMYSVKSAVAPYDIQGVTCAEVSVDLLTGEHNIIRVDLLEDVGSSMSPEVDVGQIEGAFMMGVGLYTCENLIYDDKGGLASNNTWHYKVPGVKEIPNNFRIQLKNNAGNPKGVFNSKAVGEPPLCLSCAIPIAIRQALASARSDSDSNSQLWVPIDGPTTVEFKFLNSLNNYQTYSF